MVNIRPGFKASKHVKKNIKTFFQPNWTLFLTQEAKKSFSRLEKAFCQEPIVQYFDMSKLIRLEIQTSENVIEAVFC